MNPAEKTLKPEVKGELQHLLVSSIQEKIRKYKPETESKPFFEAIFSKRSVNLASLIQSFYTTFGTSVYEQMAVLLARKNAGYHAERQYVLLGKIDSNTETLINSMHLEILRSQTSGSKEKQTELIRNSIRQGLPEHSWFAQLCGNQLKKGGIKRNEYKRKSKP